MFKGETGGGRIPSERWLEVSAAHSALSNSSDIAIVAAPGFGKSHLLRAVLRVAEPEWSIARLTRHGPSYLIRAACAAQLIRDERGLRSAIESFASVSANRHLLGVDDLHTFNADAIATIIDTAAVNDLQIAATYLPLVPETTVDRPVLGLLTDLQRREATRQVNLSCLTPVETARFSARLLPATAARPSWTRELHRLSGGCAALVVDLLDHASLHGTLEATGPMDFEHQSPPLHTIDVLHAQLDLLTPAQIAGLCVLGELGAVPSGRTMRMLRPLGLLPLIHYGYLGAAPDPGLLLPGVLLAAQATSRADSADIDAVKAVVSRHLLSLHRHGVGLTTGETIFCAMHLPAEPEDTAGDVRELYRVAARLSVSSHHPERGVALARTAPAGDDDVTRLIQAQSLAALHDHGGALRLLDGIGPTDDMDVASEIVRTAVMVTLWHLCDPRLLRRLLEQYTQWFPEDPQWHRVMVAAGAQASFIEVGGQLVPALTTHGADWWETAQNSDHDTPACHGLIWALHGDVEAAKAALLEQARTVSSERDQTSLLLHGWTRFILGMEDEDLTRALERRSEQVRVEGNDHLVSALAWLHGTLLLSSRRPRRALGVFTQPGTENSPEWIGAWLQLGRADALLWIGDLDAGERALDAVEPNGLGELQTLARDRLQALIDLRAGRTEPARRRALTAAKRAEASAPAFVGELMRIAVAAGYPTEAATAALDDLCDRFDLARLRSARLVITRNRTAGGLHLTGLSPRERQIVLLTSRGESNKAVAQQLHLSVRTVESHLHHARTKLGLTRLGA